MPGISLFHSPDGVESAAVREALSSARFFEEYGIDRWYADARTVAATTGYDDYPTRTLTTDRFVVALEGHLYDVDDVDAHLRRVSGWLADDDEESLRQWLLARDGEFLVAAVDRRTGAVRVLTDALGRLPLYRATVGGTAVLTRELKVVRELAARVDDPLSVDRLAVGQTLLLGYRLGTRTLFGGVERVPPAARVTVDDGLDVARVFRHDFSGAGHADRSMETNASHLATLFTEACRNRDRETRTVVALSGGMDSRAVAAGYHDAGVPFEAATFQRAEGGDESEVAAARTVADALDVEWSAYTVEGSNDHRDRLLEMKQGMNYLWLSFLLDFLERVGDAPGDATLVTGDGGDKVFPDLTAPKSFDGVEALADHLVTANSIFEPSDAAAVAGVDADRLTDSVLDRLRAYPESDLDALHAHFLLRERGMNWLYHGEDRNRYYYWSTSPFYSLPFFRYAMACPADQKGVTNLYQQFLSELAPEVVDVEYVNFGAPITSTAYRVKRLAYDSLARYPALRRVAVDLLKRVTDDPTTDASAVAREIRRQVAAGEVTNLPESEVDRLAGKAGTYDDPALYHLYTLTSLLGDGTVRSKS